MLPVDMAARALESWIELDPNLISDAHLSCNLQSKALKHCPFQKKITADNVQAWGFLQADSLRFFGC